MSDGDRLVDDLVSAAMTVGSNVTMPYEVALACHLRLKELRERTKAELCELARLREQNPAPGRDRT